MANFTHSNHLFSNKSLEYSLYTELIDLKESPKGCDYIWHYKI
jgi:hypothetical protein